MSAPDYVIVDGVAYPKAGTFAAGLPSGDCPAVSPVSGDCPADFPAPGGAVDPHRIHRDFPQRWQAYIRANFYDLRHVQQVFAVSERTARSWWNGETGANGGHVAVAVRAHPVAASRMLFAA